MCTSFPFISKRIPIFLILSKECNKDKGIQTIENDERTTKAHKNPNGHSDRKENTNDDDKENQSTNLNQNKGEIQH